MGHVMSICAPQPSDDIYHTQLYKCKKGVQNLMPTKWTKPTAKQWRAMGRRPWLAPPAWSGWKTPAQRPAIRSPYFRSRRRAYMFSCSARAESEAHRNGRRCRGSGGCGWRYIVRGRENVFLYFVTFVRKIQKKDFFLFLLSTHNLNVCPVSLYRLFFGMCA